jgi:hypothetical protein
MGPFCCASPINEGKLELPLASNALRAFGTNGKDVLNPKQLLAGFSLVGFLQGKEGRGFAVPSDFVPKSFSVSAHDLERGDRALMPVLDFV